MSQTKPDTMCRLRAANPARVQSEHGLEPVAQADLSRILADSGTTAAEPRTSRRLRPPRRIALVIAVMVLGAGGAVAATDPLGWRSSNPDEARYGANPALHVRTPAAQQIRCRRSATGTGFRCTPERERCGATAAGRFRCVLAGDGLAYSKFDAIHPPAGSSFSRAYFLSYIERAVADGTMSTAHGTKFRADLARVPDSFFIEYRLASRFGTYGSGSSNSRGQTLVPPPGEPNILVCQTAARALSCQDLNGDLQAPIGAGVYSADPSPGWRVAPPHRNDTGLPPGIHFTPAEYQILIDMIRYAGRTSSSSGG